ncbi:hemophore [Mycolicibacterium diernhoferi]|uniref:Hemophore n=1 Tax=Mycolicibacterium diernhoferi TaxID=1801 RepID=A0A1Q4HHP4_9MYCO|nr:hemophore [Mycolicibacterium diernhoferi]OJZ66911.1 hemophore [Mycolicibacterium diernhoferi]OPE55351.1 hemophore [Mycolicibacterium diernhoferi]PEG51952.1 hemophore [Mycolicibacterium diernhoferi]QYL23103.1 hemophore [Mycolicibacterium diernhoferi]
MTVITASARRGLLAAFAGAAVGGAALLGAAGVHAPAADAAPDPCAASQIAKTVGSVSTSIGAYLDAHPETNQALTDIAGQPAGPQSLVATKTYLDTNPEAADDLQRLQAPLVRLSTQCKLPVSLPQLLGVMQGAQTPGGLDALVTAGAEGAAEAVSSAGTPNPAGAGGTGPLPGPAATR